MNEFIPGGKTLALCLWMILFQMEKYRHCAYEWITPRGVIPASGLWMSLLQLESYTGNERMNDFIPGGKTLTLCLWMILFRWKSTGIVPTNELLQVELYLHWAYEWVYSRWRVIPALCRRMSLTNVRSYLCVEIDASVWRCLPQVCRDASLRCLPQVEMPPAGGDAPIFVLDNFDNWVYWIYVKNSQFQKSPQVPWFKKSTFYRVVSAGGDASPRWRSLPQVEMPQKIFVLINLII